MIVRALANKIIISDVTLMTELSHPHHHQLRGGISTYLARYRIAAVHKERTARKGGHFDVVRLCISIVTGMADPQIPTHAGNIPTSNFDIMISDFNNINKFPISKC